MKSYHFGGLLLGNIWLMFKKHCKHWYSSTFSKQKGKQIPCLDVIIWQSGRYYLGKVYCNIKMANLAQIITSKIWVRNLLYLKCAKTLFCSVFWQTVLLNNKLGHPNWPNLARKITSQQKTLYIYIYIYIFFFFFFVGELNNRTRFGVEVARRKKTMYWVLTWSSATTRYGTS